MKSSKLTPDLAARLRSAHAGELLDVVVELAPPSVALAKAEPGSRAQHIAVLKDAFAKEVEPVVSVIRTVGGEILGTAWINHTVRCRVPVEGVDRLSQLDTVLAIDLPHTIEADASPES